MPNDKNIITKTNDGYVVELFANVKTDFDSEIINIAEGISIIETKDKINEEEQFTIYKDIVEKMDYNPIMMKITEDEKNMKQQLRALLRAAKYGDLSIAASRISTVDDIVDIKELVEECQKELEKEELPYKKHMKIGIIVEIPSVALMSYELARECDFFFIDINSLTDYTFGNKKKNKTNPELYMKLQPAIIKLLQQAKKGAHDAGIYCGVCGDAIENELYMPLLIGLGLDQFSMNPKNILNARKIINELDKSDCKEIAEELLELRMAEDVERKLRQIKHD